MSFKFWISQKITQLADVFNDWREGYMGGSALIKAVSALVLVYLLVTLLLGWYWSVSQIFLMPYCIR